MKLVHLHSLELCSPLETAMGGEEKRPGCNNIKKKKELSSNVPEAAGHMGLESWQIPH